MKNINKANLNADIIELGQKLATIFIDFNESLRDKYSLGEEFEQRDMTISAEVRESLNMITRDDIIKVCAYIDVNFDTLKKSLLRIPAE